MFVFNTVHAGALRNYFAVMVRWRHEPVSVPALKEQERSISTSAKNSRQDMDSASAARDILTPSGFWKIRKPHSLLFGVLTQDPSVQRTPFQESVWQYSLVALHTFFYLSGDWNHFGFHVLHNKLVYCTCLTVRHFLGCIEIEWQNMNKAMDICPFLFPAEELLALTNSSHYCCSSERGYCTRWIISAGQQLVQVSTAPCFALQ